MEGNMETTVGPDPKWCTVLYPNTNNLGEPSLGTMGGAQKTSLKIINTDKTKTAINVTYQVGSGDPVAVEIDPLDCVEIKNNVWNNAWVRIDNKSDCLIAATTFWSGA